jgi:monofunctional biosynthetic peptidoglycan transglycosylase
MARAFASRIWRNLRNVALLAAAGVVLLVALFGFVNPPTNLYILSERWRLGGIERDWAPLREISEFVPLSAAAAEDANFCLHWGFDFDGIRAALADEDRLRGGSTISQQVAKNVFLWQGRSWARKAAEVWYVLLLEQLLSKERILELYLGVAETGPLVFGLEAGAQHHYKKPAHELTADQAARLAGILPDPLDRKPSGKAASDRARWIHANPAPFPGDKHYDLVLAKWEKEAVHPWQCLF